ncbi:hypothetical protein [Pasteuria penetrans]|uniref:hypothetical protein n=1 Tax=Pasteuria penetrans TaxID=86005 RepID=UPI0011EF860B|nr:hypothetical protein [Pasteuria penetrans]
MGEMGIRRRADDTHFLGWGGFSRFEGKCRTILGKEGREDRGFSLLGWAWRMNWKRRGMCEIRNAMGGSKGDMIPCPTFGMARVEAGAFFPTRAPRSVVGRFGGLAPRA